MLYELFNENGKTNLPLYPMYGKKRLATVIRCPGKYRTQARCV